LNRVTRKVFLQFVAGKTEPGSFPPVHLFGNLLIMKH
jgi:hypothetical protein